MQTYVSIPRGSRTVLAIPGISRIKALFYNEASPHREFDGMYIQPEIVLNETDPLCKTRFFMRPY